MTVPALVHHGRVAWSRTSARSRRRRRSSARYVPGLVRQCVVERRARVGDELGDAASPRAARRPSSRALPTPRRCELSAWMVPSRSTRTKAWRLLLKIARRFASDRRSASSARAFSVRARTARERPLDGRADPRQVALEEVVGGARFHAADRGLLVDRAGDDEEGDGGRTLAGEGEGRSCRRTGAGCSRRGSRPAGTLPAGARRTSRVSTRRESKGTRARSSSYSTSSASIGTSSRIRMRRRSGSMRVHARRTWRWPRPEVDCG